MREFNTDYVLIQNQLGQIFYDGLCFSIKQLVNEKTPYQMA